MSTSLPEAMSRATDEELFEILHLNRAQYSVEAIAVAEEELRSRNLQPARLEELQTSVDRKKQRAVEPLSFPMKLLLFLCGLTCFGILLVTVVEIVYHREADRKYREAWRWMGYGFAVAITIVVLLFGLSFVAGLLSAHT